MVYGALFATDATQPHIVPLVAARNSGHIVTEYDLSVEAYVAAQSTSLTPVANLDVGRERMAAQNGEFIWVKVGQDPTGVRILGPRF